MFKEFKYWILENWDHIVLFFVIINATILSNIHLIENFITMLIISNSILSLFVILFFIISFYANKTFNHLEEKTNNIDYIRKRKLNKIKKNTK